MRILLKQSLAHNHTNTTTKVKHRTTLLIIYHYYIMTQLLDSLTSCLGFFPPLFCDLQTHIVLVSVITSSLVWFHSLCSLALPVDLGGWQSHPAQPDRLLETEQPSSLHWTHKTDQTSQNNTCGQNRHREGHAHRRTHTWHTATTPRTKREATQPHIHFMDREGEWEGERLFGFSEGQHQHVTLQYVCV